MNGITPSLDLTDANVAGFISPHIIWIAVAVAVGLTIIITLILIWHWRKFNMIEAQKGKRLWWIHFVVVVIILVLMTAFASYYQISQAHI